jgi:hypothetical protein
MSAGMTWDEAGSKFVAGAVEVHGQEVDDVHAVLLAVGLALHQQHLLGDPVGRIRLLGIAVPQALLAEGDGGELGIRADGADADDLGHAREAALLEEVGPHHHVVEEERARVLAVRADAPDPGRQMDDDVGPGLGKATAAGLALDRVVVALARRDHLGRTALLELGHHGAAQEAAASGHDDASAGDVHGPDVTTGAAGSRRVAPSTYRWRGSGGLRKPEEIWSCARRSSTFCLTNSRSLAPYGSREPGAGSGPAPQWLLGLVRPAPGRLARREASPHNGRHDGRPRSVSTGVIPGAGRRGMAGDD